MVGKTKLLPASCQFCLSVIVLEFFRKTQPERESHHHHTRITKLAIATRCTCRGGYCCALCLWRKWQTHKLYRARTTIVILTLSMHSMRSSAGRTWTSPKIQLTMQQGNESCRQQVPHFPRGMHTIICHSLCPPLHPRSQSHYPLYLSVSIIWVADYTSTPCWLILPTVKQTR